MAVIYFILKVQSEKLSKGGIGWGYSTKFDYVKRI
jgi:hypothetical protein